MRGGEIEITVAADAVPSFDAPNNRVVWLLRFVGEIRAWPDVDEHIVIPVGPGSQR